MAGTEAVMVDVGLAAFVWFWGLVEERWALNIWCTIHRNLPGGCWHLHFPYIEVGAYKAEVRDFGWLTETSEPRVGKLTNIVEPE